MKKEFLINSDKQITVLINQTHPIIQDTAYFIFDILEVLTSSNVRTFVENFERIMEKY